MGSWEKEGEVSEETSAVAGEAELVDAEAQEEQEAGEVSFGLWDCYDFGATAAESLLKTVSSKSTATSTIETDAVEVA